MSAATARRSQRPLYTASISATVWAPSHPVGATVAHVVRTRLPPSVSINDSMAAWSASESRMAGGRRSSNLPDSAPSASEGKHVRGERQHAGELGIARGGCDHLLVSVTAQRMPHRVWRRRKRMHEMNFWHCQE
jgi:hypothetical protein